LIKAVIAVESAFDSGAVSPKGAIGLMQVLPDVALRYGLASKKNQPLVQRLRDPATNVMIGVRYLRDLLARFPDDLTLALAAYNAGEQAVAQRGNRVPPFPETRAYVKLVQQLYALYRPAQVDEGLRVVTRDGVHSAGPIRGTFLPHSP